MRDGGGIASYIKPSFFEDPWAPLRQLGELPARPLAAVRQLGQATIVHVSCPPCPHAPSAVEVAADLPDNASGWSDGVDDRREGAGSVVHVPLRPRLALPPPRAEHGEGADELADQ